MQPIGCIFYFYQMDFINAPVDVESIPQVSKVTLSAIHPNYLKILRYEWIFSTIVLVAMGVGVVLLSPAVRSGYWWVLIAATVIGVSSIYYFLQEKSFPFKAYAIREKDVIFQKGWLLQTTTICPFNRIQNCSVQSGPWERKFGLASLIIYTAGAGGADLRIPGLLVEEAEKLRHFILQQIHGESGENI
jgi:uncharacterized protein